MKGILYTGFLLIVAACSTKQSKQENLKSVEQQNTIFRRVGYTINNGKCYEKEVDITPVIKIDKGIVSEGEFITGKVYYPTNYFNKLAKCYNFKYRTTLILIGDSTASSYAANEPDQDTVRFSVSPDSLVRVARRGLITEYQIRAKLRAAFSDELSGYDTTGRACMATVLVRKKVR